MKKEFVSCQDKQKIKEVFLLNILGLLRIQSQKIIFLPAVQIPIAVKIN